mgnify:CR=1 FL=1
MASITGQDETLMNDPGRYASLTVGCLLAGGLSRRMGGVDKSLMMLGERTMISVSAERLAPQVGPLVVNANGDPARFADLKLPVVADAIEGFAGPLAGVLAGMTYAREHAPNARWVVTVACDTPFFPTDLVGRLVGAAGYSETMIALARSGNSIHPVFGLWPVALADDLEAWLNGDNSRKVLAWVDRHQMAEVRFGGPIIDDIEIDPFFNVNTPEDLETAAVIYEELNA